MSPEHHGISDNFEYAKHLIDPFGSGVGAGIAVLLGKRGANVVVNYVSEGSRERAEKVVKEIESNGTKAIISQADVSKLDEIPRLVDSALQISQTGKIEILIHKCVTSSISCIVF